MKAHVEPWGSVDLDDEVVGVDDDLVEQLVEQGAAFLLGGDGPDEVEVEPGEDLGDLVEGIEEIGGRVGFDLGCQFAAVASISADSRASSTPKSSPLTVPSCEGIWAE